MWAGHVLELGSVAAMYLYLQLVIIQKIWENMLYLPATVGVSTPNVHIGAIINGEASDDILTLGML
jgi:hypothetical protein